MTNCQRCGIDLGPHPHGNRRYHPKCKKARDDEDTRARAEAGRAQRLLKHDTNCKRCHLDLGPHHANREYHPECQKAQESENRSARRAATVDRENEQQRTRYAEKRASLRLRTVECGYREKGIHKFKTRDRRLRYCSDEHRELQKLILGRAGDRAEYWANREKHLAKGKADYKERMRQAALGKRTEAGEFIPAPQIDMARIELAARLGLEGLKAYAMTDQISLPPPDFASFSEKRKVEDRKRRFDNTKKFLKNNRLRIELAKQRLASSPPAPQARFAV